MTMSQDTTVGATDSFGGMNIKIISDITGVARLNRLYSKSDFLLFPEIIVKISINKNKIIFEPKLTNDTKEQVI